MDGQALLAAPGAGGWRRFGFVLVVLVVAVLAILALTVGIAEVCPDPGLRPTFARHRVAITALAGAVVLAMLALAYLCAAPLEQAARTAGARLDRYHRSATSAIVVGMLVVCWLTASVLLQGFANSADEWAFRFQGWTLASGRLWLDPPPLGQAESPIYVWATADKWVGQYPPGWPALLALAGWLRLPETLVNAALIAGCAWAVAAIVRRESGAVAGVLAALAFALSPFAIFNGSSPFAHPLAALAGLLFVLAAERWLAEGRVWQVAVAGVALGAMVVTRYVSAVPVFAPFAALVLWHWLARRRLPGSQVAALAVLAATSLPFLAALLLYHWAITGDPLKTGYWLTGSYVTELRFDAATLALGVPRTAYRLAELARWTSPLLLVGYAAALAWKLAARRLRFYDLAFPLTLAILLAYPSFGGTRWGPRYYFDAYPFLVLTTATGLAGLAGWAGERLRPWLAAGTAVTLVGMAASYPGFALQAWRTADERLDFFDAVAATPLDRAVVLIDVPSGRACPMPVESLARNVPDRGPDAVRLVRGDRTEEATARAAYPDRAFWAWRTDPATGTAALVRLP